MYLFNLIQLFNYLPTLITWLQIQILSDIICFTFPSWTPCKEGVLYCDFILKQQNIWDETIKKV